MNGIGWFGAWLAGCVFMSTSGDRTGTPPQALGGEEPAPGTSSPEVIARHAMVRDQIAARGLSDPHVLAAMAAVPRERFVPGDLSRKAHADHPLPIGEGQTISQPYIVALMTELLALEPGARVLEVGTGSGYQAAVLAEVGHEVWTIEIVERLGEQARHDLDAAGYGSRIHTRIGDGYRGWPEAAPFDGIIVTAAPGHVPEPLREQLAVGGRLVIPVGDQTQELKVITRTEMGFTEDRILSVLFVPMTGEAQTR